MKALVLLAYYDRAGQKWADAKQHAERGLQALPKWTKPEGVSDADFEKQKTQFSGLLSSVAGLSALQLKDYPAAQKGLRAAVEADPKNVENVYPLALAYLSATPSDDVNGLFFIARAANLITDPKGKADVIKFGHSRYLKYHGAEDGWNELLAQTATTPLPPADFTIKQYVPPTPAEQAADIVKQKKPETMDFAEWELVLSEGKPEDVDVVWTAIKGKPLQFVAQVISVTPTKLTLAASVDDIQKKVADIELTMNAAIPAKLLPKEGAELTVEGTPVSYTPKPFMMVMEKGSLLTKAPPAGATEATGTKEARAIEAGHKQDKKAAIVAAFLFVSWLFRKNQSLACRFALYRQRASASWRTFAVAERTHIDLQLCQGPTEGVAMHSKLTSRTALVPLILLKNRQNEAFFEFTNGFRVKNVALVHL